MTKIKFLSICIAVITLISCKTSQMKQSPIPVAGMFKITILYPSGEGKNFDMDYYENRHMPMVAGFLGSNLKYYEIDKGISGRTSNDKAPFTAVGYFFVTDVAAYNLAIAQNIDAIRNDIPKYTNIQPTIQISELKYFGYNKEK